LNAAGKKGRSREPACDTCHCRIIAYIQNFIYLKDLGNSAGEPPGNFTGAWGSRTPWRGAGCRGG
jgi:hypothetical protein